MLGHAGTDDRADHRTLWVHLVLGHGWDPMDLPLENAPCLERMHVAEHNKPKWRHVSREQR